MFLGIILSPSKVDGGRCMNWARDLSDSERAHERVQGGVPGPPYQSRRAFVNDDDVVTKGRLDWTKWSAERRALVEYEAGELLSHVPWSKDAKGAALVLGRAQAVLGGERLEVGAESELLQQRKRLMLAVNQYVASSGL